MDTLFQKIWHSLVARVLFWSAVGTLVATLAVFWAVTWTFERLMDTQLDNHLTAYADVIAGAIKITNGKVIVDDDNVLLKSIPRHWQIDTESEHVAKSPLLSDWLPLSPTLELVPERIRFEKGLAVPILAVRQGFEFPQNKRVVITFGLEEHIANAYKEQIESRFIGDLYQALLISISVLLVVGLTQALIIIKPLRRISSALQEVRTGKKDRIEMPFPVEIKSLSDEINKLLGYVEGSIKRYRTHASNLSHSLKTPLTVIRSESDSKVIQEQVDTAIKIIDRNLSKTQAAGTSNVLSARTPIRPVIERICNGFSRVYSREIEVECPEKAVFRGDQSDLFEVLGNLLENACKYGHSRVRIRVTDLEIVIEDDGPGIPESEYQAVFERGARLDTSKGGSGLGMSIARDIIELYGGILKLESSSLGGLKVSLRLPSGQ